MKKRQASSRSNSSRALKRRAVARRLLPLPSKPLNSSSTLYGKLDDYQQSAVGFCLDRRTAGLFFEQGTGKTWIAGGVIDQLATDGFIGLVVVPLANIETTWETFFKEQLPRCRVARSYEDFKTLCMIERDRRVIAPIILLLHYEAVPKHIKWIRKENWTIIVYDEAHRLKDRASLQSRTAAKLRHSAHYKMILSGTPIEKQPQDLWAQFRFLAPEVLGEAYKDFEGEFIEDMPDLGLHKMRRGGYQWQQTLRKMQIIKRKLKFRFDDKLELFLDRIKPHALRVEARDVLDLPSLTMHRLPVRLLGRQRRIYEALEKTSVAQLNRRTAIVAPLRVSQIMKMQQVCGGHVHDGDGNVHDVGKAKIRRLMALLRRHVPPVVIFCRFLSEIDAIVSRLRQYRVAVISGQTKDRAQIQRDFQKGKIDYLVCQIRSGGVGIDLFRACTGIFYSLTYSFIDFDQALKRLHRRGQENPVDIFLIYARGTVDADIYDAILSKRKVTEVVLSRLRGKKSWLKRRK